jgi:integrase
MNMSNPKLLREVYKKVVNRGWERVQTRRADECIKLLGEGILVTEVNETHVEHLCTTLEERGLSGSTINRYMAALSKLIRYAFQRRSIYHLDRMPHIEWREEGKARIRYVLPEEEKEIISALKTMGLDDYLNFYLFLMDTGMRLGEALQFAKRDVQIDAKSSFYVILHGDMTKNGHTRSVPLTLRAKSIIKPFLSTLADTDKVFGHIDYWQAEKNWRRLRNFMGLEDDKQFVIHCLRHTCATRLAQSGKVELHLIKEMLGHRNYAMTLRYSHFKPNNLLGAINVLDSLNGLSNNG